MGVTGIWEHMQKYFTSVDIDHLRNKSIAVDGHIWLYESSKGCSSHGLSGASYLVTFFNRCQRLREHGIEPVVVFDHIDFSPDQMDTLTCIKKSKRSGGNGWSKDRYTDITKRVLNVQTLLKHMGVRCVVGGSDGEAQCAQMEQAGIVHGCITSDFDYFLFGGRNLYKVDFLNGSRAINPSVVNLTMDKMEQLHLNRYRLVALAMLLGCDYMEGGIGRVGIVTALEIVSEFSLHDDDHTISILDRFAGYHRHELPHRDTDSALKLKLRNAKIDIPDGFPNTEKYLDVANIYLAPKVQNFTETNLTAIRPINMKQVSDILYSECNWRPEKFALEVSRSQKRTTSIKKVAQQPRISDFFSSTRRRSAQPVVELCSQEDRLKCSQREWAAMERLRSKSVLYTGTADAALGVDQQTPRAVHKKTTAPPKRPRKRILPGLVDDRDQETSPTSSGKKRRTDLILTDHVPPTPSDTSSIIILD